MKGSNEACWIALKRPEKVSTAVIKTLYCPRSCSASKQVRALCLVSPSWHTRSASTWYIEV